MASYSGLEGYVKQDANSITELASWTYTPTVAERITTNLSSGGNVTRAVDGLKDGTGTLTFNYDPDDTAQQALLEGSSVTLNLYPLGDASGKKYFEIPAIIPNNDYAGGTDVETQLVTLEFRGNGAMTRKTV